MLPDVFGKVWGDGKDEKGRGADEEFGEGGVHADVEGDFAVPVAGGLELVETVLESVFVVGPMMNREYDEGCVRGATYAS